MRREKDFFLAGKKLAQAFAETLRMIKPGMSLREIDQWAERAIEAQGGRPSFKMVAGYRWTCCLNLNEGVVHGIPNERKVQSGDVVSLDMGLCYRGWHADMAYTFIAGKPLSWIWQDKFLKTGREALEAAISQVKEGERVARISEAIERKIREGGFFPVETLTGHGIGRELHQDPFIPCVVRGEKEEEAVLSSGQGLAIEVIYLEEETPLVTLADGWTIQTKNGKIAGLFEKTVVVRGSKAEVLTPFLWEKNAQG